MIVTGTFQNKEDIGVYGTPIAEVDALSKTYTNSGSPTYFPPHERIEITITIEGIEYNDYQQLSYARIKRGRMILSEIDVSTCPDCDGKGYVTCPECGGALTVGGGRNQKEGGTGKKPDGDITTSFTVDWTIVGVGIAAAGAIVAVVVVKKKKVTEKDLRRLTSNEFQNWVVQRLSGKASSLRDSRIGIDAYTAEGHPVQIKQSDNIGRNVIENFASLMGRIRAKNGIIVAFSFSDDVYRGIVRARINYRIEINKVTVKELIENKGL